MKKKLKKKNWNSIISYLFFISFLRGSLFYRLIPFVRRSRRTQNWNVYCRPISHICIVHDYRKQCRIVTAKIINVTSSLMLLLLCKSDRYSIINTLFAPIDHHETHNTLNMFLFSHLRSNFFTHKVTFNDR